MTFILLGYDRGGKYKQYGNDVDVSHSECAKVVSLGRIVLVNATQQGSGVRLSQS